MSTERAASTYHRDRGDGLLLRWFTSRDTEGIVQLGSSIFRDGADAPLNIRDGKLVRELMSGRYPLMGPGDFALIEDTHKQDNPLVACTCLWRHVWEYEGIPFSSCMISNGQRTSFRY